MSGQPSRFLGHPFLVILLAMVVVLLSVVACRERDGSKGDRDDGILSQATNDVSTSAATAPISSQEGREIPINRIAYIGRDGNVYTIKPDGTDSRRLTSTDLRVGPAGHILAQGSEAQVFYAWPTWAPDSSKLAVSRVVVDGSRASFFLEEVDAASGKSTKIYENEPDTVAVTQSAPHYVYWSNDSLHLSFIASTPRELALFVTTLQDRKEPVTLIGQGPIYFSWAGDSSAMSLHRGGELFLVSVGAQGFGSPELLGRVGLGFRAPALSKDGSKIVYTAGGDSSSEVYLADTRTGLGGARSIGEVGSFSAFLWSPTRDELAFAHNIEGVAGPMQRLVLAAGDGSSQTTAVSEPLVAFFWSPDGEKIAYITHDVERRSFTWKYVDRSGGEPVQLAEFVPSEEFIVMVSFFDQYAHSNSVWSPDSSQIVFSGAIGPTSFGSNGDSPAGDRVYVMDVREGASPKEIATSSFAVWSWR